MKNTSTLSPPDLHELHRQALALYQQGQLAQAASLYNQILTLQANHIDALYALGLIEGQTGNPHAAAILFSRIVLLSPNHTDALFNYGNAMQILQHHQEALASYEKVLSIKPQHVRALIHAAQICHQLNRSAQALYYYDQLLMIDPHNVHALFFRASTLFELKRFNDALNQYDQLLINHPKHADAWINRGITFRELEQQENAIESYAKALAINPNYAQAYSHQGNALRALGHFNEAFENYKKAIELWPEYADAHYNLSIGQLMTGNLEQGWQEYEWRWQVKELDMDNPQYPKPLWLGEQSLQDKTILIYAEQGLGDIIQFSRYIKFVKEAGAKKVLLGVSTPLKGILSQLEGVDVLLTPNDPPPVFDVHCPIMSLPLAFKTRLDSIPASIPYLRSDASLVSKWATRLGPKTRPRVGLVWSGNPKNKNNHKRSMLLEDLDLLQSPDIEFFALQKQLLDIDAPHLKKRTDITPLGPELDDFKDTAAVIDLLDLVITVDTSVAHLAGAMGKPVWIMLAFPNDWRWLLDRDDSPWYPTARLFRQQQGQDWISLVKDVKTALTLHFKK